MSQKVRNSKGKIKRSKKEVTPTYGFGRHQRWSIPKGFGGVPKGGNATERKSKLNRNESGKKLKYDEIGRKRNRS